MNRLAFLSWGTLGMGALGSAVAVSVAAVGRFLVPSVFYEPPQSFKIGNPADFPYGPPTFMADEKIFVFRDRDKGFAVASAVCTHLGCTVAHFSSDQKFHCPCHGSFLYRRGSLQRSCRRCCHVDCRKDQHTHGISSPDQRREGT